MTISSCGSCSSRDSLSRVQSAFCRVELNNESKKMFHLDFDETLNQVPCVIVQVQGAYPNLWTASAYSITKTGCEIAVVCTSAQTMTVPLSVMVCV